MKFQEEVREYFTQGNWIKVNKKLLSKMISEYLYEDIISPKIIDQNKGITTFKLEISDKKSYVFKAIPRMFESFEVIENSISLIGESEKTNAISAVEFLIDIQTVVGIKSDTIAYLIKEIQQTLVADLHIEKKQIYSSDELADADYCTIEASMTGHPWIVYNKGRIGFGYDDYLQFSPESKQTVKLGWLAIHRSRATFQSIKNISYNSLLESELNKETIFFFNNLIKEKGKDPDEYLFLPIHEWQWKNIIISLFAEDIANEKIIPLGEGPDNYLPQQSIRTFVNQSYLAKHHVKLPMSILNTLVYRGLPSERTIIAPKITEYIKNIYNNDKFLKEECRVILPGEIASINVDHPYYNKVDNAPYQYLELLGGIWRESIYSYLEQNEKPVTLAALLYSDHNGKPFIKSLIDKSGLTAKEWITELFKVLLPPLLHYLYKYGTVFSPHGQNTILVLKNYVPHRLAIKDFVDDVNISNLPLLELSNLDSDLKSVLRSEKPEGLTQFILTGLFIGHSRYLSRIVEEHLDVKESEFWSIIVQTIMQYQNKFTELGERFEIFDLFKPEITKLCLNRNRMIDYGYADANDRPHASEFGKVQNALAVVKEKAVNYINN